ncbi:uncharacterized protein LOC111707640 isoform X2 [Eurytemora carolleeae]|uniref:uncharacterized protein LOC111707640 isoform X2 n=1 Tax=Eurytemora carolleeae TaxID=1294199 RepID=UPI000C76E3E2|nr:uncharacterized protein LOC111707640 isoform X2 [Eurytemora carolleeae]|eukprot:XP_023336542.1 uncharacterized protein LOC111707640 isoform X2 [Eurytemora affinis]
MYEETEVGVSEEVYEIKQSMFTGKVPYNYTFLEVSMLIHKFCQLLERRYNYSQRNVIENTTEITQSKNDGESSNSEDDIMTSRTEDDISDIEFENSINISKTTSTRDLTDLRKEEEGLRELEERFALVKAEYSRAEMLKTKLRLTISGKECSLQLDEETITRNDAVQKARIEDFNSFCDSVIQSFSTCVICDCNLLNDRDNNFCKCDAGK